MRLVPILLCCALGACSSPGPTPQEWANRALPVVDLDPTERELLAGLEAAAMAAQRQGQWDLARRNAERALELDPRAARARAVLGRTLLEAAMADHPPDLDLSERAEGEMLLARNLVPDDPGIELLYARFLEVEGQLSGAAAVLDAVLEKHPEDLPCLRTASRLHFELSHERRAADYLRVLLQRQPGEAPSVYRLGLCQFRLAEAIARGDTDQREGLAATARLAFLEAAATYRNYQKLRLRDLQGFLGEAAARYRALLLAPTGDHVIGEVGLVRAVLTAAAELAPESPAPAHNQGLVHEFLGEPVAARQAYERALRFDPGFLPALLNLIRLVDAQGDKALARQLCERALTLSPTDDEARRLRRYLAQ